MTQKHNCNLEPFSVKGDLTLNFSCEVLDTPDHEFVQHYNVYA